MFVLSQNETLLNSELEVRLGDVLEVAVSANDTGVIEWVGRAYADAKHLGKLRTRDTDTLARLERTYASDFYRNGGNRQAAYA